MVAIAGKIADRHLGVGDRCLDHRFDIAGVHRHPSLAPSALPVVLLLQRSNRGQLAPP
jgi:hypothetical protein